MIKITTVRHDEEDRSNYDVLAHKGIKLIGSISLQIVPDMSINLIHIRCGLITEVKVDADYRMQGIAQSMLKAAMGKFTTEKVDIALLSPNINSHSQMYSKVGFVLSSTGQMIASVNNRIIFDQLIGRDGAHDKALTI